MAEFTHVDKGKEIGEAVGGGGASIPASWLGVSPWLLQPLTNELESLDLPKRSSQFAFRSPTFWNWT